jgi:hypothetical protein
VAADIQMAAVQRQPSSGVLPLVLEAVVAAAVAAASVGQARKESHIQLLGFHTAADRTHCHPVQNQKVAQMHLLNETVLQQYCYHLYH